jgi:hypothetical protein
MSAKKVQRRLSRKVGGDGDQFLLRMPPGMREQVVAAAKLSGRSLNGEFVDLIAKSLEQVRDPMLRAILRLMRKLEESLASQKELNTEIGAMFDRIEAVLEAKEETDTKAVASAEVDA